MIFQKAWGRFESQIFFLCPFVHIFFSVMKFMQMYFQWNLISFNFHHRIRPCPKSVFKFCVSCDVVFVESRNSCFGPIYNLKLFWCLKDYKKQINTEGKVRICDIFSLNLTFIMIPCHEKGSQFSVIHNL